ncbi:MAG: sugar-transfer associated ATP-grasp domain-containing protein [Pseudomonadota bacterium]
MTEAAKARPESSPPGPLRLASASLGYLLGDTLPSSRLTVDLWVLHAAARMVLLTPDVLPEDRRSLLRVLLPPGMGHAFVLRHANRLWPLLHVPVALLLTAWIALVAVRQPDLRSRPLEMLGRWRPRLITRRPVSLASSTLDAFLLAINTKGARILRDKRRFHDACQQAGLPTVALIEDAGALPGDGRPVWTKPRFGGRGQGHRLVTDPGSLDLLAEKAAGRLIQPVFETHPEIRHLSPDALATQRVVTVLPPGQAPRVLFSLLRTGARGSIVANRAQGGTGCWVDLETGQLTGENHLRELQPVHPNTGETFRGIPVPAIEETIELCRQAHRQLTPDAFTVGWDVGVTPGGPIFLEGNSFCYLYPYEHLPWDDWYTAFGRHLELMAGTAGSLSLRRRWRHRATISLAVWLAIAALTASFMAG